MPEREARHHEQVRPRAAMPAWLLLGTITTAASCTLVTDFDRLRGGGGSNGGGGEGGEAPAPCAAGLERDACGEEGKCTLVNPAQGTTGGFACGARGAVEAWSGCASDEDCADGTWCDEGTSVCKPWCESADDCPADAACVVARRADGTAVSGLKVCTAHCVPTAPEARCGADATCVLLEVDDPPRLEGDCVLAGDKRAGCLCAEDRDCEAGLRCDADDGRCRAWCSIGGLCPGGASCDTAVTSYAGESYGQCDAPTCFNN